MVLNYEIKNLIERELGNSNSSIYNLLIIAYKSTYNSFYVPFHERTVKLFEELQEEEGETFNVTKDFVDSDLLLGNKTKLLLFTIIGDNNWDYQTSVAKGLQKLRGLNKASIIQVLVVSKLAWEKNKQKQKGMVSYKQLRNHVRHERTHNEPLVVLFCEDLI